MEWESKRSETLVVPQPTSFKLIALSIDDNLRVSELLAMDGSWNLEAFSQLFIRMDVQLFLSILVGIIEGEDSIT